MVDGAKIRRLREEAGLRMHEIAEAVGVSEMQVSYYERCLKNPSVNTLKRIADKLGVKVDELYLDSE